jgi:cation:H+ antiporter
MISRMMTALLTLLASGAVLVLAGTVLTRAADVVAERSGIGRLWIGSVLLAAATSLPELATDVSAVRMGVPDLAAGDLFGSSMANMLILAALGMLPPSGRIFRQATPGHALTACLAMALNAAAGVFVLSRLGPGGGPVGLESILLLAGFVAGVRMVYAHRPPTVPLTPDPVPTSGPESRPLSGALVRFGLASLAVLAVAPLFASSAERIAVLTGLGSTFVGTWLVGLCTSLPEVVTSIAAIRLGAVDLAIGNLFGSNAFNMAIFFAMDLAHPGGSIFAVLDPSHAISALIAVALMAVGLAAIVLRGEGRVRLLEPSSSLMLLMYLGGLWALYLRAASAGMP